jgi:hypothetical protein
MSEPRPSQAVSSRALSEGYGLHFRAHFQMGCP